MSTPPLPEPFVQTLDTFCTRYGCTYTRQRAGEMIVFTMHRLGETVKGYGTTNELAFAAIAPRARKLWGETDA